MALGKRIPDPYKAAQTAEVPSHVSDVSDLGLLSEKPKYTFNEIILNQKTRVALDDVLTLYSKRELLFDTWGLGQTHQLQNRTGINLYGPSGTGKTMAAHAIASELKREILTVSYSQIESKYVGETAKNLERIFMYAKRSGAVLFFDEADALLSRRVTDMSNATDVSVNQTRSVLLLLLNDFDDIVLFATNFISNYDPAFLRRILAHIKFELPDKEGRVQLWRMYVPEKMPTNVDIKELANKFVGVTGSDISNAVLSGALHGARSNEKFVRHEYFENAMQQIIQAKEENEQKELGAVSKRVVSEDYVREKFGGKLPTWQDG